MEKWEFLGLAPLFAGLEPRHLQAIADLTLERSVPKGAVVFFEGDPGDALYMVRTGMIKVYRVAEDGRETTLAFLAPGEAFGELAILDDGPRSAIAEAMEPSLLYALGRQDFLKLLREFPDMSIRILRILSLRLRRTNELVSDLVFRDVRSRVAHALLRLSESHGSPSPIGRRIEMKLTHQELANHVGTARETVSRILAHFQDEGLITLDGRTLILADEDGLKEISIGI